MPYLGRAPTSTATKIEDADQDTKIQVEESSDEDTIRFDIAGAEDFRMTANTFTALAGSTIAAQALTATSLTGLTTPLTVAQGGSGAATHTANGVLLGAGTGAMTTAAPSTSGNVLTSNGTVWASATPSGGASETVTVTHNLTTASGSLAVTGFGFQPRTIIVHAMVGGAAGAGAHSYGSTTDGGIIMDHHGLGSTTVDAWDNNVHIWNTRISSGNQVSATIASWDADGITFTVTKAGSPTGYAIILITGFKV